MSTYMQANQPYQRVTSDSVWEGAAVGALAGAGITGARHLEISRRALRQENADLKYERDIAKNGMAINPTNYDPKFAKEQKRGHRALDQRARYFGSGWRGALTYGGTAAVGSALGIGADALIE